MKYDKVLLVDIISDANAMLSYCFKLHNANHVRLVAKRKQSDAIPLFKALVSPSMHLHDTDRKSIHV